MTLAISQSRSVVSRANPWVCSGRRRTNSYSATTVCGEPITQLAPAAHLNGIEFGVYVDRHGDATNRQVGVIEWEGTAERVAFHPPYVIIFDSRFIEIRHIAQGKLVQIIQGTDIHCTWDGRGNLSRSNPTVHPVTPGPGGWDENVQSNETRIHAVMKAEDVPAVAASRGTVAQHVFELSPTQLLYAPTALQPQTSAGYFQTSHPTNSPLRSPRPPSIATGRSR